MVTSTVMRRERGHLLVEAGDALFAGELSGVLGGVGEQVVHLLEAEVLAVVVSLRHL